MELVGVVDEREDKMGLVGTPPRLIILFQDDYATVEMD